MNLKSDLLDTPEQDTLWRAIMRPGCRIMLALRVRTKLMMVAASLIIPLCVLMAITVSTGMDDIAYVNTELDAVAVAELLTPVVLQNQALRTLTLRSLSGDASAAPIQVDVQRALRQDIALLDERLAKGLPYDLMDHWPNVRRSLLALIEHPGLATVPQAFAAHAQVGESLRQLALMNGERSGLILDPQARSYHLMDLIVNSLIPMSEATAAIRGLGASALLRGSSADPERADIAAYSVQLQHALQNVSDKLGALDRSGGHVPPIWPQAERELAQLAQHARQAFIGGGAKDDPTVFLERGASAVSQVMALQDALSLALKDELQNRKQGVQRLLAIQAVAFAVGITMLTYLLMAVTLSFRQSMGALTQWLDAIAKGNLSARQQVPGRDELADMGVLIDSMSQHLSVMVAGIRSSAAQVDQTGQRVAQGSTQLAIRTDEQASSLRSSVLAIGQLNDAVEHNARAVCDLDVLTQRLFTQAEGGNTLMTDTVQSMHTLQGASERVVDVIASINDIAFQTGMLALNAAIEAARAGASGKGFAIVANEVRQLSLRCAESADEINALVAQTDEITRTSVYKLMNASQAMSDIVGGIKDVSDQLRSISESSTQQSVGLQDVTHSVGNLNDITRENAALVEESTTSSNTLVGHANSLRQSVVSMKLRQGSGDEAVSMVEHALAHIALVGRQQALVDFHDPHGPFIDRDLYIFSINREGIYAISGAHPELVGQHFKQLPGLDDDFAERVWAKVQEGGGWLSYNVMHPVTGAIAAKRSYVLDGGDGHALGCGVFQ